MSRPAMALLAAAALLGLAALGCSDAGAARERTIVLHFSRFGPEIVSVPAGVPVTFGLRNDDPIDHEWIVGLDDVHERHRTGSEPYHDEVPTEVTVPALSTRSTTLTFAAPGEYTFICHLPGHEAYGMRGTVRVLPS